MNTRAGGFHVHGTSGLVGQRAVDLRTRDTHQLAEISRQAPRVPWDIFLRDYFTWEQGEHLALIAPTGQGKTTALMNLLPQQPYIVVFATKPKDTSMDRLISEGYLKMSKWENIPASRAPHRVLWPSALDLDSDATQRAVFHDAFERIYREGGWCVAIDEGYIISKELRLDKDVKKYLTQGRSLGISLAFATQRPVDVPVLVYDQSTHVFFGRDNDEVNLKRISGISWRSANLIRNIVANLDQYQMLYVNTRTGEMVRTRTPSPRLSQTEYREEVSA
jgi:hypothetical protein